MSSHFRIPFPKYSSLTNPLSVAGLYARQLFFKGNAPTLTAQLLSVDEVDWWTIAPWVSDANVAQRINLGSLYTHVLNFGENVGTSIYSLIFTPVWPNSSSFLVDCTATTQVFNVLNPGVSLAPNSDLLGRSYLYGGAFTVTLKALIPGAQYKVTFFHYPLTLNETGTNQQIQEPVSGRLLSFRRSFRSICSIWFTARETFMNFNFTSESRVYALICEQLSA